MELLQSIGSTDKRVKFSLWILLLVISSMVLGSFITVGIDTYERARFQELIDGTAYKPYVYRSLVPTLIRSTLYLVPDQTEKQINEWGSKNIPYLELGNRDIHLTDFMLAIAIWYISIVGFALMVKKLANSFYSTSNITGFVLSIIAIAGLPVFFSYHSYIYDFTHLFLFTTCLYLMIHKRWSFFLILFALTTFSKETSILLVFIFLIHYKSRLSQPMFYKLLTAQIGIFVLAKGLLMVVFYQNPGSVVEFQLFHNLRLQPYSLSQFIAFIVVGVGLFYRWDKKPPFLKHAFYIIIPLLFLSFFLGFLDEYRGYYEFYPIALLLIFDSVSVILNLNSHSIILPKRE